MAIDFRGGKKSIFDTISALKSIGGADLDLSFNIGSMLGLDNLKNVGTFIVSMLKQTFGIEKLKKAVGELTNDITDKVNTAAKEELQKQTENVSVNVDVSPTKENELKLEDIDFKGELKNAQATDVGDAIYFDNGAGLTKNKIREAIELEGTWIDTGECEIKYNSNKDRIRVRPKKEQKSNEWLAGIVATIVILDKKVLYTTVIDFLNGSVSKNSKATQNDIANGLKERKVIEKIINDEDDIRLTNEEIRNIEDEAERLKNGTTLLDLGCGLFDFSITLDDVLEYVE
jgi:hypothetical protein